MTHPRRPDPNGKGDVVEPDGVVALGRTLQPIDVIMQAITTALKRVRLNDQPRPKDAVAICAHLIAHQFAFNEWRHSSDALRDAPRMQRLAEHLHRVLDAIEVGAHDGPCRTGRLQDRCVQGVGVSVLKGLGGPKWDLQIQARAEGLAEFCTAWSSRSLTSAKAHEKPHRGGHERGRAGQRAAGGRRRRGH
jgi:hypothetical protein